MKHFTLHYHDAKETSLYFRCQADDAEHAREQLEDAERHNGPVIFWEVIKEGGAS